METSYENLYYACSWCNRAKWDTWPLEAELTKGYRFVDPCKEDLYGTEHSRIDSATGRVESRSNAGDYTIQNVRLNRKIFCRLRVKRFEAQEEINRYAEKVAELEKTWNDTTENDLLKALKETIQMLDERFVNPKVPYEAADLKTD